MPSRVLACLGLYVLGGGIVSFAGWVFDIRRLTDWDNNGISIQPNTALVTTATGAALICMACRRSRVAAALGGFVGLVGGITLTEYLLKVNIGIDTLLMFDRPWGRLGTVAPGRMGPPGALSWTLIGVALVISFGSAKARALTPARGLLVISIASISLTGYLYGADRLYSLPTLTTIALQTATFLFVAGVGLLLCVPEREPMRTFLENSSAGVMLRRLVPFIFLIPLLVGWLIVRGRSAGLYDAEFGTAVRTIVEIVFFSFIALRGIAILRAREQAVSAANEAKVAALSALRATDARAAALVNSISDGFHSLDRNLCFTYFNEAAKSMFVKQGVNTDALLGMHLLAVFPDAHELPGPRSIVRCLEERIATESETFYPPWDRWFAMRNYPADDGGVATFFIDITERKRADEALRESERALAAELSSHKRLQEVSTKLVQAENVEALYGEILATAMLLMESDFASIQKCHPDRGECGELQLLGYRGFNHEAARFWEWVTVGSRSSCAIALQDGQRVVVPDVNECDFMAGTEDLHVYLQTGIRAVQTTPLLSRSGVVLGMISTHWRTPNEPSERALRSMDILARIAADLIERHRHEDEMRQADRKKDEFLATLAHELRNPLAPVMNSIELIKRAEGDPALTEQAHSTLERQVKQMSRLIDDLLDVSRITRGRIELKTQRVELASIIHQAMESCRHIAESAEQALAAELPSTPIYLDADPVRLAQVVGNILNNACKYTPQGGRIALRVSREGSDAVISVEDTGVGISHEMLPQVFEMFTQVDRSLERSQGGLGIGLSLAKNLVELHGGSISARSDGHGLGSTFVVRLPLLIETPESDEPTPGVDRAISARRILVVDDNRDSATTMAMLLRMGGSETQIASDGAEAVEKAAKFRPELILLDIGLPKKNGYEACREIRQQPWGKSILMIALTGWGQAEDRQKSKEAGFNGHLVKPIEHATLVSLLAELEPSLDPTSDSRAVI